MCRGDKSGPIPVLLRLHQQSINFNVLTNKMTRVLHPFRLKAEDLYIHSHLRLMISASTHPQGYRSLLSFTQS